MWHQINCQCFNWRKKLDAIFKDLISCMSQQYKQAIYRVPIKTRHPEIWTKIFLLDKYINFASFITIAIVGMYHWYSIHFRLISINKNLRMKWNKTWIASKYHRKPLVIGSEFTWGLVMSFIPYYYHSHLAVVNAINIIFLMFS